MAEQLYLTVEGPGGTVQVFEISSPHRESDAFQTVRADQVWFEVRHAGGKQAFWQEGEAASVACEIAGVPYGNETGPRPAGPTRGISVRTDMDDWIKR